MKTKLCTFSFLPILLIALSSEHSAQADTVVYQQGGSNAFVSNYGGTDDTHIDSVNATSNNGAGGVAVAYGSKVGLLRFNLSSFSGQYSSITSISLSLGVNTISGSPNGIIEAYAILPANSGWVEGTSLYGPQNGSSCWNYAVTNGTTWAGLAGLSMPDVDFDSSRLGLFTYNTTSVFTMNFAGDSSRLTALIDAWVSPTNPGLLLKEGSPSHTTDTFCAPSDIAAGYPAAQRPTLTITYSPVPEPGTFSLLIGGWALLSFRRRGRQFANA